MARYSLGFLTIDLCRVLLAPVAKKKKMPVFGTASSPENSGYAFLFIFSRFFVFREGLLRALRVAETPASSSRLRNLWASNFCFCRSFSVLNETFEVHVACVDGRFNFNGIRAKITDAETAKRSEVARPLREDSGIC